ncbi:hypothetical protein [Winogradskyella sp.]|uniref:hypothetical protein n=1 Tax=Winogradskyella sp. TaxID=1883156 RepID=UPI002600CAC9|nr:hypothetical protein [Winogradskyella sp.]
MVLRKPIVTVLLTLVLLFVSCNDKTKNEVDSVNKSNELAISNNTQFLEDDGIQLLLPENFKRYSSAEYEVVLKTLAKGKILDLEEKRLRHLRNIDGNHYIYFDKASKSTILVNTIPFAPILKQNASSILADITRDLSEFCKMTKQDFSKITGKYSETPSVQIFKSVHKVYDKRKKNSTRYQHKYYLAFSKDKNLIIDINTTLDFDFDNYLAKIKF